MEEKLLKLPRNSFELHMLEKPDLKKLINKVCFYLCLIFFGLVIWLVVLSYFWRNPIDPLCDSTQNFFRHYPIDSKVNLHILATYFDFSISIKY